MKRFCWTIQTLDESQRLNAVFDAALELTTGHRYQDREHETHYDTGGYSLKMPTMTWAFLPPEEDSWSSDSTYYTTGYVEPHDLEAELWLMVNLPEFVVSAEITPQEVPCLLQN